MLSLSLQVQMRCVFFFKLKVWNETTRFVIVNFLFLTYQFTCYNLLIYQHKPDKLFCCVFCSK